MFSLSYSCRRCGLSISMARPVPLTADVVELSRRGLCRRCFNDLDVWHDATDPSNLPRESGSYFVCTCRRDPGSREAVVSTFTAHFYADTGRWSHRRPVMAWRPLPLPDIFTLEE